MWPLTPHSEKKIEWEANQPVASKWWFIKSWTVWVAVAGFALCWVPLTRKLIHEAELGVIQFQAITHIVLRFKTEERATKLSAQSGKEEG